jgi:hypothetical protein
LWRPPRGDTNDLLVAVAAVTNYVTFLKNGGTGVDPPDPELGQRLLILTVCQDQRLRNWLVKSMTAVYTRRQWNDAIRPMQQGLVRECERAHQHLESKEGKEAWEKHAIRPVLERLKYTI